MDVSSVISGILKKVVPDLIGATVSLVTAYWLLQAISADAGLMRIIRLATTIFIVLYLAIILIGASLQVIDDHKIRKELLKQIQSGSNPPRIVDAGSSPRLISSSFSNSSSYYLPHNSKNILPLFRIVAIIIVVVCVLGSILVYFHFIQITIAPSSTTSPTPSVIATNPWSSWQTIPNRCRAVGGIYDVSTPDGQDLNACYGPKTRFKNFTYEVEMTVIKGRCGGLLFRKSTSANNYYVFQVCQDKTYALLKYIGKNFQPFFGVSRDNNKIHPGLGIRNTIAVTAKGSTFTLSINRVPVAVIDDTSYSEGVIGLVASSDLYYIATKVAYQKVEVKVN